MVDAKTRSINPANFFLVTSLLVGLLYCIVIPYGAGFDEERHLVRIYYMSQGHIMPNFPRPVIHEIYAELSYQRRLVQTPAFDLFSRETFLRRFSDNGEKFRYGQRTQSIYSPFIFLPQALIGRILWWRFDFPFLPTVILQRFAGLLVYIAGAYVAIRAVPFGKWIFTALALLPAVLYQASTLNADGYTTGVSFVFIGWVIAVYVNERSGIRPRSVWILILISILLGLAKPGAIVLLPLLLILITHSFPSKKWIMLLCIGILLTMLINIGWWSLASQGSTYSEEGAQSVPRQMEQLISDPDGFIKPLLQSMILTFPDQVKGLIAGYGYWAGRVPEPVYFFSALFLLAALLGEPKVQIPLRTRIFFVLFFLICVATIYSIVFAGNYSDAGVLALAKHGRYYIPFLPLFFLGFAGLSGVRENTQWLAQFLAVGLFLLVTGFYSFGIYTTYYTYCGYDAYIGGKCILPIYKNLEKETAPEISILDREVVTQTFTNMCGDLEMVQVFVKSMPEASAGSLRFTLLDEQNQILARQDFSSRDVIIEDYLGLSVEPPGTKNATFMIQLEAVNLSPGEKIAVTAAPQDSYPGQLSVNGIDQSNDLLIHYTCAGP